MTRSDGIRKMSDAATAGNGSKAETVLEGRHVSKSFAVGGGGTLHAVVGVSIAVRRQQIVAVVGESGSGKTTLLNLLLWLLKPNEGTIRWLGQDVEGMQRSGLRRQRSDFQFIAQDPFASLNPRRKILQSVGQGLRLVGKGQGETEDRVGEALELVRLERTCMWRYPHEFSGGERQRIAIARAIATRPRVILADEPTSSLDASVRKTVVELMAEIRDRLGSSFVLATHDFRVVERLADSVAVMCLGQVVEFGETQAVLEDPRHAYTRLLLSSVPVADPRKRGNLPRLRGDVPSPVLKRGEKPVRVNLVDVGGGHLVAEENPYEARRAVQAVAEVSGNSDREMREGTD